MIRLKLALFLIDATLFLICSKQGPAFKQLPIIWGHQTYCALVQVIINNSYVNRVPLVQVKADVFLMKMFHFPNDSPFFSESCGCRRHKKMENYVGAS
jgi:hypothetical protein